MPMAPTPLEQLVVAAATKWTGFCTEVPLPGLLTETPEKANTANESNKTRECNTRKTHFCMGAPMVMN